MSAVHGVVILADQRYEAPLIQAIHDRADTLAIVRRCADLAEVIAAARAGIADLADAHGGGYSHVTTRAGLQVREINPEHAQPFLDGLTDLGLTAQGAGADNIRNVTGSPAAGIDARLRCRIVKQTKAA